MPAPTPPATNFPWAPDANYPAGTAAWSGQPTKVDPADDKFTPGESAPAPHMNSLLNDRDTFTEEILDYVQDLESSITMAVSLSPEGTATTTSTTTGVTAGSQSITVATGDKVVINACGRLYVNTGGGGSETANCHIEVVDPNTTTYIKVGTQTSSPTVEIDSAKPEGCWCVSAVHTALGSGTLIARARIISGLGDAVSLAFLNLSVIRKGTA